MSHDPKRARESWLNDGDDDHFGDAVLLCHMPSSGRCYEVGTCQLGDRFCFRGFGSAEARRGIEQQLNRIEATLQEFLQLAFDQRRQLAINKIREDVQVVRDNVLPFGARRKTEAGS